MNEQMIKEVKEKLEMVQKEIKKAIVGQTEVIEQVLIAMLADGNVLLESVPGLGKTQLVKTFSKVMNMEFSRIQFTPDLMPGDVTGTNLIVQEEGGYHFKFQKGPIFANLVLADEINRATPKTQSALLEAMQEKTVTTGTTTYKLEEPFMVLATQNPIENEGTYPLPEAQLDRFLMKILISFPTKEQLRQIVELTMGQAVDTPQMVMTKEDIKEIRDMMLQLPVADSVMEYAMSIVAGTHPEIEDGAEVAKKYILCGSSPRSAQALIKTAKARAFLKGRYNVAFEDIEEMAYPVLRHRLLLNFEAISEGITPEIVIQRLLEEKRVV